MSWTKNLRGLARVTGAISEGSSPCYTLMNKQQNSVINAARNPSFKHVFSEKEKKAVGETLALARYMSWKPNQLHGSRTNFHGLYQYYVTLSRQLKRGIHTDPDMSRDFLVKLWVADWEMEKARERRTKITPDYAKAVENVNDIEERSYVSDQSVIQDMEYASREEALIAPLLSRSNLLITRDIEWANLTFGFEQENRYAIVDVCNPHAPAGFIREESNVIVRQLLRGRRPFVAYITDGYGNELFRVRRPFWWITSSIYAEVGGKEIGVVHRRWHLWRRIYDLYLGNEQFAVVENPGLWNWTFTLKGSDGEVLAQIDRDWRGFGFEIFTDAGQYVIRFGNPAHHTVSGPARNIQELEVARPLTLSERAVVVALAVSLDNDYFSRHGGWGLPFIAVEE